MLRKIETLARTCYWLYRRIVINCFCIVLSVCKGKKETDYSRQPKRLLVLTPEGMIGDFVLMSPFLRALRELLPDTFIGLGVPDKTYILAENCPYVDEVIKLPFNSNRALFSKIVRNIIFAWRELRGRNYDTGILTTDNVDYYLGTFMLYFADIPVRIGFGNENSAKMHPRKADLMLEKLLTIRIAFADDVIHQRDIFFQLLTPFGKDTTPCMPELWPGKNDVCKGEEFLKKSEIQRPCFVLGVSTTAPKKDWGIERYAELVRLTSGKINPFWIFIGPLSDRIKYRELFPDVNRAYNAAGEFSLTELYILFKNCDLYIGPDSGPAHIAAAAGCRILEINCHPINGSIYSINSPERFGVIAEKTEIVRPVRPLEDCSGECRSLYPHCILNITAADVLRGLQKLF